MQDEQDGMETERLQIVQERDTPHSACFAARAFALGGYA